MLNALVFHTLSFLLIFYQTKHEKTQAQSNLLAELLQVGNHTVAQAIFHVISQQVWCSHDSQSLPQGLWKKTPQQYSR